jgi:4'-phosphopantetheinyl transferase
MDSDLLRQSQRESTHILSISELQIGNRYKFNEDREKYLACRLMLRKQLGLRLGLPPSDIAFEYGPYGKPAIARNSIHGTLQFNLSHSGDCVVMAFSSYLDLGADVEFIRDLENANEVAMQNFSEAELAVYFSLPDHDKPIGFFNCWTRKEAFVKTIGVGLGYALGSFDVNLRPREAPAILSIRDTMQAQRCWHIHAFTPISGYIACVVAATGPF